MKYTKVAVPAKPVLHRCKFAFLEINPQRMKGHIDYDGHTVPMIAIVVPIERRRTPLAPVGISASIATENGCMYIQ